MDLDIGLGRYDQSQIKRSGCSYSLAADVRQRDNAAAPPHAFRQHDD